MSERKIIADVSECALLITCRQCGSSMVLDLSMQREGQPLASRNPYQCPTCEASTGQHDRNAMDAYRSLWRQATAENRMFDVRLVVSHPSEQRANAAALPAHALNHY